MRKALSPRRGYLQTLYASFWYSETLYCTTVTFQWVKDVNRSVIHLTFLLLDVKMIVFKRIFLLLLLHLLAIAELLEILALARHEYRDLPYWSLYSWLRYTENLHLSFFGFVKLLFQHKKGEWYLYACSNDFSKFISSLYLLSCLVCEWFKTSAAA